MKSELLFRDLLINVTCFFRDPEAFDFLRRETIPELLRGKGARRHGAHLDARLLQRRRGIQSRHPYRRRTPRRMPQGRPSVQILATDIDEQMLQRARSGSYPHTAVKEVPPELLDRLFSRAGRSAMCSTSRSATWCGSQTTT